MGSGCAQSLYFIALPDLRKLCCVYLSLPNEDGDEGAQRNHQVKMCRELVLMHADIIASPALGSFQEIVVVMGITFYKRGIIQAYAQSHSVQMGSPQTVLPGTLQTCLSYSLTVRLAPDWNKAGRFLIAGKDFLSVSGKLNAIVMELSVAESQLCVSLEANTVRLPPATEHAVIETSMPGNWCFVLPSMKKGQIVHISHRLPPECPFRSYTELKKHWLSLYGYQLPTVSEEGEIYCSVYFRPVGERLFTYPLICIRTQPVQCFPRVNLQGVLGSFLSNLRDKLDSVCGFPVCMTSTPFYHNSSLNKPAAQSCVDPYVNVTTKNSSRPVLTQMPRASFSQSSSFVEASHLKSSLSQPGAQSFSSQSLANEKDSAHPNQANLWMPQHSASEKSFISPSSSVSCPITSPLSSSIILHKQNLARLHGQKLVPIFKNKTLPKHVNITKILVEKRLLQAEENLGKRPSPTFSCPPSTSFPPTRPLGIPPLFPHSVLEGLSLPLSKKPKENNAVDNGTTQGLFHHSQNLEPVEVPGTYRGDDFAVTPKKPKCNIQDIDVEMYARSNQLGKVNMTTLQAWLRSRGVAVRTKEVKEELMSKVMRCLNEA
ncbi:uncharacterized protein C18orf63 homolog isoform X2 [Denticeps clupeoides]|uniref:uncharacterized protein C18orf63 homolog isoform X2 n=1 Tax=Denticeps clupeoides TaxID=299321 RepID=UPI0010A45F1A|nr:uncharacterized protein C18orf63 homolog isoform X2 [Denticeps clupeoides]